MDNKKEIAASLAAQGIHEIVWREGQAVEQFNPDPVYFDGAIESPRIYLDRHFKIYGNSETHFAVLCKDEGTIKLTLNSTSRIHRCQILGKISKSQESQNLGLNKDIFYSPEKLAQILKLRRSWFVSSGDHAKLCATLRNLKAKVNATLDKADDRKGNIAELFRQTVTSNIPDSVKMKMPLIKGGEDVEFDAQIILEVDGVKDILCFIESIEAEEWVEAYIKLKLAEEKEAIEKYVVVLEK
jgi:hypothetical protein